MTDFDDGGFLGRDEKFDINLINMNERLGVYPAFGGTPVVGRFLNPDNFVQQPGNTQSYNRYSYCLNNPLKYTDPSGEIWGLSWVMQFINDNTTGLRNWMVKNRVPDFMVGGSYNGEGAFNYTSSIYGQEVINTERARSIERMSSGAVYASNNFSSSLQQLSQQDWKQEFISSRTNVTVDPLIVNSIYIGSVYKERLSYLGAIKMAWDCRVIGSTVPDNISLNITISAAFVRGNSMEYTINLLTRGEAGFYLTRTEMDRWGSEFNLGINANISYYKGNPLMLDKSKLLGPVKNVSGGYFYGGELFKAYDDNGFNNWDGAGTGIGFTAGGSYGWGKTKSGWFK
jgi:hypothetical protein